MNGDGDELTDLTTNAPKEIDTEISGKGLVYSRP